MNVSNNINNRSNVNFNGAIKIKANEAKVLLAKIDSKWPTDHFYVNKVVGDLANIYFFNSRVEKVNIG